MPLPASAGISGEEASLMSLGLEGVRDAPMYKCCIWTGLRETPPENPEPSKTTDPQIAL